MRQAHERLAVACLDFFKLKTGLACCANFLRQEKWAQRENSTFADEAFLNCEFLRFLDFAVGGGLEEFLQVDGGFPATEGWCVGF